MLWKVYYIIFSLSNIPCRHRTLSLNFESEKGSKHQFYQNLIIVI